MPKIFVKPGTSLHAIVEDDGSFKVYNKSKEIKYNVTNLDEAGFVDYDVAGRAKDCYVEWAADQCYEIGDLVYYPGTAGALDPIGSIQKIEQYEYTWNYLVVDRDTGDENWRLKQHLGGRVYRTRKIQDAILSNK